MLFLSIIKSYIDKLNSRPSIFTWSIYFSQIHNGNTYYVLLTQKKYSLSETFLTRSQETEGMQLMFCFQKESLSPDWRMLKFSAYQNHPSCVLFCIFLKPPPSKLEAELFLRG
jgi:hypothetical protein